MRLRSTSAASISAASGSILRLKREKDESMYGTNEYGHVFNEVCRVALDQAQGQSPAESYDVDCCTHVRCPPCYAESDAGAAEISSGPADEAQR